MFQVLDIVFPWGTAFLATFLCVLAALATQNPAAKIICALCCAVFILPVPVLYGIRYTSQHYDYQTPQGLKVRRGKINRCDPADVTKWEQSARDFWLKTYPAFCIDQANSGALLVCLDTPSTESTLGRFVRGYAWQKTAVITYQQGNPRYTESLFLHEFSHLVLFSCLGNTDQEVHHRLFKDLALGH
jgi:hypothetical protein